MEKLPKPKHEYGYPKSQVIEILTELGIPEDKFWEKFGTGNTCMLDPKTNEFVLYERDIELALWEMGHKLGKYHVWD